MVLMKKPETHSAAATLRESEERYRLIVQSVRDYAHDLRSPLSAIGGYAELIEMGIGGAVSAQQHEYLDRIRAAQQHLLALINDLLSLSRIETA